MTKRLLQRTGALYSLPEEGEGGGKERRAFPFGGNFSPESLLAASVRALIIMPGVALFYLRAKNRTARRAHACNYAPSERRKPNSTRGSRPEIIVYMEASELRRRRRRRTFLSLS